MEAYKAYKAAADPFGTGNFHEGTGDPGSGCGSRGGFHRCSGSPVPS